ncbi:hypothetical protein M0R45_006551 [Rubus argutus]|uniref:Uncharacterized protein n=1 Tax=Rubus argutus TaxID=59490 RepID=A0AAW1YQX3_RUBAR
MRAGYEGGVAAGMDMQRWIVGCRERGAVSSGHGWLCDRVAGGHGCNRWQWGSESSTGSKRRGWSGGTKVRLVMYLDVFNPGRDRAERDKRRRWVGGLGLMAALIPCGGLKSMGGSVIELPA